MYEKGGKKVPTIKKIEIKIVLKIVKTNKNGKIVKFEKVSIISKSIIKLKHFQKLDKLTMIK